MNLELTHLIEQLAQAGTPEEVFGGLSGQTAGRLAQLRKMYHRLAKVAHPDIYQLSVDRALAHQAFGNLTQWFAQAEEKIKAQTYGQLSRKILRARKREYVLDNDYTTSDLYTIYTGSYQDNGQPLPVTLKIVREPRNNDLAQNEAKVVRSLMNGLEAAKFSVYVPKLIESLVYEENNRAHHVNVFERLVGWQSLEEVHQAYPSGIDPKDMAWMWRRLLVALGFAHLNRVIHGAILPPNVFILPEAHGLLIDHWSAAAIDPANTDQRITTIGPKYRAWMPIEILSRDVPVNGTDIAMAAQCMIYLLGGDPPHTAFPNSIPATIKRFLISCTLPDKRSRPQAAWGLKAEFDEAIEKLWGERKFRPFKM